jgi:5-deoxy-glucuronate isomerase
VTSDLDLMTIGRSGIDLYGEQVGGQLEDMASFAILPETEAAEGLLVVEVITPGGHWSSYPPHKHDTAMPVQESALEETCCHRLQPPQGFAIQRVYTDDRSLDETISVEDGDVVMVSRGYHPVSAPHGYDLCYLNVMAGPERNWIFRNDPAHDWIVRKP